MTLDLNNSDTLEVFWIKNNVKTTLFFIDVALKTELLFTFSYGNKEVD